MSSNLNYDDPSPFHYDNDELIKYSLTKFIPKELEEIINTNIRGKTMEYKKCKLTISNESEVLYSGVVDQIGDKILLNREFGIGSLIERFPDIPSETVKTHVKEADRLCSLVCGLSLLQMMEIVETGK